MHSNRALFLQYLGIFFLFSKKSKGDLPPYSSPASCTTVDVNKAVVSNRLPCNNGKDWRYIVGYQVDGETIMPLFTTTSTNTCSCGESQYGKNSAYTMSFNVSEVPEWMFHYQNIWNEVELQFFEKLAKSL